jgi:hypothetical protein
MRVSHQRLGGVDGVFNIFIPDPFVCVINRQLQLVVAARDVAESVDLPSTQDVTSRVRDVELADVGGQRQLVALTREQSLDVLSRVGFSEFCTGDNDFLELPGFVDEVGVDAHVFVLVLGAPAIRSGSKTAGDVVLPPAGSHD